MSSPISIFGREKMPKYNTFKYGRIGKYGRYDLRGSAKAVGPYVRYRMRLIDPDGNKGEYVTMAQERIDFPAASTYDRLRIRCNNGEWAYTQTDTIAADAAKIRIRSIDSNGDLSEWMYGERANLKQI